MYTLKLTFADRKTIDFCGHRYAHGDDLWAVLTHPDVVWDDEDTDWADSDNRDDITFTIPEYLAWEINKIRQQSGGLWDCFSEDLRVKMEKFCDSIV